MKKHPEPNATLRVHVAADGTVRVRNHGGGWVTWAGPRGEIRQGDLKLDNGVTNVARPEAVRPLRKIGTWA